MSNISEIPDEMNTQESLDRAEKGQLKYKISGIDIKVNPFDK